MPKHYAKGELKKVAKDKLSLLTSQHKIWISRPTGQAYKVKPYDGGDLVHVFWPVVGHFLAFTFIDNFKPYNPKHNGHTIPRPRTPAARI